MGLLLIISATLSWDAPKYFGSAKELMATLGAALIILCGENNKFDILLTNKVCRKIGQISYSLYLIHWPIIVFYNYYFLENFSHLESVLLIAFSIVMALLMYRYIEQPLRIKSNQLQKIDKKQTTIYFLVSGLLLIILAANAWGNNGWPSRFKNLLYPNLESQFNVDVQNSHTLIANNSKEKFAKNTPLRIVALGDSHSADLTTGILQNITSNIEVQNILFHSSCYSERDTRTLASQVLGKQSSVCANNLSNISENTLIEEATHIIIAQKWAKRGLENLRENILSVKNIFGDRLVILGQNVFFTKLYPIIFSTEVRSSLNSLAFKTINPKNILFNDQLRKIATSNGIRFLDRQKIVCDFEKQICLLMAEGGGITYIDSDHWSSEGDRLFGKIILSQILNYK